MRDETPQGGTEWELKEAENAMVAAGLDPAALALAMRRHAEAQRNMMQSVLVPSFINATSSLIDKSAVRVVSEIQISIDMMTALVQQVITMARESNARLGKVEKAVIVLKKGQTASDKQMAVVDKQLKAVIIQLEELGTLAERTNTLAEEQNRLVEEQNRLAAVANELTAIANDLALEVAELKVRIASVEARGG